MDLLGATRRDIRAHAWDYVLAAGMVGFALVVLATRIDVQPTDTYVVNADSVASWLLTIALCATLAGRRRWPLRSLAVGLVLLVPLELAGQRDTVGFFALVIGLYSVAAHLPLRLAWRGVGLIVALYSTLVALGSVALRGGPQVGNLLFATAFALGRMLRRARLRQEREADAAMERAARAVETAELHAADDRLRMAQELHDVVAHSLSVIAVQAGIGAHLIDRQPAQAAAALDAIRATGRTTSGEVARLVDILRDGTADGTARAPGLADVDELVDQIRTAGLPVGLSVEGDLAAVPAGSSLAAFRIVQEALTNVVRHAGRAAATVTIAATEDRVELRIEDDGRGLAVAALEPGRREPGQGLIGMDERAQLYGGQARCEPRPGGGFRVQATLRYLGERPAVGAVHPATAPDAGDADAAGPDRRPVPAWCWDLLLAVSLAALAVLEIVLPQSRRVQLNPTSVAFAPTNLWAWSLRIGCCLTVAARRRSPNGSYAAALLAALALTAGDYQVGMIVFVLWIGLYTVASRTSTRSLVATVAGTYVALAVMAWSRPPDLSAAGAVFVGILFAVPTVGGYVVRRERARRDAELTERESHADAQARRARLVIANERLRIAGELNTIVNRSIDTIARHASEGSDLVAGDPTAARATLEAISAISRDALGDLRRLVKHLRDESGPAPYAPPATVGEGS